MSVIKNRTNKTINSTSRVEAGNKISLTSHHYELRSIDVTASSTDGDVTSASLTSYAPAGLAQQAGGARTSRPLQVPDPGERWMRASRRHHGVRVAVRQQRRREEDAAKTQSAVIVISSVFFATTVISTLVIGIFCRKRNTVFVLQKCEQRDYADDDDDDEESLSVDCDSTTSPTVATRSQVNRKRRRVMKRSLTAPATHDLSLFCTSQRTGSGSCRRDSAPRRSASEARSSWVELRPATTLSTGLPVECTDDDSDDGVKYRVTRDVVSASDVTGTSGLYGGDASTFRRSTSLDGDVCRYAPTCGSASSQSLTSSCKDSATWRTVHDLQTTGDHDVPSDSSPCRVLAAGEAQLETSAFELSMYIPDDGARKMPDVTM